MHTPGPWIYNGLEAIHSNKIGTERELICLLGTEESNSPYHHSPEEVEANARLIAAAPDLLMYLENLLEATEEGTRRCDRLLIKNIHKLIRKIRLG